MMAEEQAGGVDLDRLISEGGFEDGTESTVAQLMKSKYGEYKRGLSKREAYQGGKHLCGFNWRVKVLCNLCVVGAGLQLLHPQK